MFTLTVNPCTGFEDLTSTSQVTIFPNPSNGLFKIQFDVELEVNNVSIVNQLGQVISFVNNIKSNKMELDLSEYNNGIYYIKANTSKGVLINKLAKSY
jgi:hypothetical protein